MRNFTKPADTLIISVSKSSRCLKGEEMNAIDIINKKREAKALNSEEIEYMIMGYTEGTIPDYQMSALLMAICLQGMSKEETVSMTEIMRDSGDVIDLSGIDGIKVDKHSTGGVGDKTTLIVAPIAAACGVPIAKMSGRGLGFTGGTVDKMESIPGFRTSMERSEFINAVNTNGIAVIGQTGHIAPADKKIYALRDVTGTVQSTSLITASIMSKKLAAGSDAIVLDVKCGSGAFMKNLEDAEELARWMVDIGKAGGKDIIAIISDMSQPLGMAVGNALEGPEDISKLSIELAAAMIMLGGEEPGGELDKAKAKAREMLDSGKALKKFKEFVQGQGGDPAIAEDYKLLPQATHRIEVMAKQSGFVSKLDALTIGLTSQHIGAGREKKEDSIDMSAGIVFAKKLGDRVNKGDLLCTVCGNDLRKAKKGAEEVFKAYEFGEREVVLPELIKTIIR